MNNNYKLNQMRLVKETISRLNIPNNLRVKICLQRKMLTLRLYCSCKNCYHDAVFLTWCY
jgi:hypothetical protein